MNSKTKLNFLTLGQAVLAIYFYTRSIDLFPKDVIGSFYDVGLLIFGAIAIIDIIYKPINKKTFAFVSILLLLSLVLSITSTRNALFVMILLSLALRDVDIEDFLARDLIIRIAITVIVLTSFFKSGVTIDEGFFLEQQELGFGHHNSLGMMLSMIGIETMLVARKNNIAAVCSYLLSIGLVLINNFVCRSRTSMFILAVAIVFFALLQFKLNLMKFKVSQIIIRNSYAILTILSFVLVKMYESGSEFAIKLNDFFSNRLDLSSYYLSMYKLNLFGNNAKISYTPEYVNDVFYYVVDMGYIWVPIIYGIIGTLIIYLLYNLSIRKLFEKQKYHLVVLLIAIFLYGVMENGIIKYEFNTFMVLLTYGLFFFEKEDVKEKNTNRYLLATFIGLFVSMLVFRKTIHETSSLFFIENNPYLFKQYHLMLGYYEKIHTSSISLYDWTLGLGGSFYNLIKEGFLSPFNLLILPFSREMIKYVLLYINLIKIILVSVCSCLWTSTLTNNKQKALILSFIYTSSSLITMFWPTGAFDVVVLLPLSLYFTERYIKTKKTFGLIASLLVLFFTNPIYAIPISILLIVYFLLRSEFKNIIPYILTILLSLGSVAFIMLPSLSFFEPTSDITFIELFKSTFTSFANNGFSYGIILCLCLCSFIINDKKKLIFNIIGIILMIILAALLNNLFGDFIIVLPYVYSIVLISTSLNEIRNENSIYYIVALAIFEVCILVNMFISDLNEKDILIHICLFLSTIVSLLLYKKYKEKMLSVIIVLCGLLVMFNFTDNVMLSSTYLLKDTDCTDFKQIRNIDNSFYRIANDDGTDRTVDTKTVSYNLNYAYSDFSNNIPGILINNNEYDKEQSEIIKLINDKGNQEEYTGFNKNEISIFDITGVKYWVSSDVEKLGPSYFDKVEGTNYYINNYYIELGYVNNKTINASSIEGLSTFEKEKILREYVALEESDNLDYQLDYNYNLEMLEDYTYFGLLEHNFMEPVNNVTLVVNSGGIPTIDVDLYMGENLLETRHYYSYDFCNVDITTPINRIVVRYEDVDESGFGIRLFMMKQNRQMESELYEKRISNSFTNVVVGNNTINADINISEDNSLVYTYVPYDEKWNVKVDNQEVDILKANYGFIAFRLPSGQHHVEFIYETSNLGSIISFISVLGLASFVVFERTIWKKKETKQS